MSKNCSCHGEGGLSAEPVMGVLTRPRYVPGLILEDSDLTAAVDYTRELNRLLFKSLFGCGVVCGLEITLDFDCGLTVMVSPGLALDGCGDPIHLIDAAKIKLERKDGVLPPRGEKDPEQRARNFWVIACAKEKNCAPRALVCDSDDLDGAVEKTRTRSAVEVSVTFTAPECVCGCNRFDPKADADAVAKDHIDRLNEVATQRDRQKDSADSCCCADEFGCHEQHYSDRDCPADCGCGTACACGCCVLLAWVHWDTETKDWRVLQEGVRRFIRPCLMSDPIHDGQVTKPADTDTQTTDKTQPIGEKAPEPVATVNKRPEPRKLEKPAPAVKAADSAAKSAAPAKAADSTAKSVAPANPAAKPSQ